MHMNLSATLAAVQLLPPSEQSRVAALLECKAKRNQRARSGGGFDMVKKAFCSACGAAPAIKLAHAEVLCECDCGRVYRFAELFGNEAEYPLTACFTVNDAVRQWNHCVGLYRKYRQALAA